MKTSTIFRALKNLITQPSFFKEYVPLFTYNYFFKLPLYNEYTFLNGEQTIEYLLKNKKNFIRLGDGEFAILYGFDIYFQKYDPLLRDFLIKIIENYTPDSPYLLGLPKLPAQNPSYFRKPNYWNKIRIFMRNKLDKECVYGDPFIARMAVNKEIKIFRLWKNKSVLLVGSMVKYFRNRKLELAKRQYLVDCPTNNAFKYRQDIMKDILNIITINHLKKEDVVILISLGPTAKIITYDLGEKGLIVYDMGHYFDFKYQKIEENLQ